MFMAHITIYSAVTTRAQSISYFSYYNPDLTKCIVTSHPSFEPLEGEGMEKKGSFEVMRKSSVLFVVCHEGSV